MILQKFLHIIFLVLSITYSTVWSSRVEEKFVTFAAIALCGGAMYQFYNTNMKSDDWILSLWLENNEHITLDDKKMFFNCKNYKNLKNKGEQIKEGLQIFFSYYEKIFGKINEDVTLSSEKYEIGPFLKSGDVRCGCQLLESSRYELQTSDNFTPFWLHRFDRTISEKNRVEKYITNNFNVNANLIKIEGKSVFKTCYKDYLTVIEKSVGNERYERISGEIKKMRDNFVALLFLYSCFKFPKGFYSEEHQKCLDDLAWLNDTVHDYMNQQMRLFLDDSPKAKCKICYELGNMDLGRKCDQSFICQECFKNQLIRKKTDCAFCGTAFVGCSSKKGISTELADEILVMRRKRSNVEDLRFFVFYLFFLYGAHRIGLAMV